jgi:hypothetical protein
MVEFSFRVVALGNTWVQRLCRYCMICVRWTHWSPLVVQDFIEDLGYQIAGRVKMYWLRSGKGC